MKLHFYGTAASEGVPSLFCHCKYCEQVRQLGPKEYRSRTCTGINDDVLIDFSADVFDHMRYGGLDLRKIKTIFFTHAHPDHFYPEDLIRISDHFAHPAGRSPISVYGSPSIINGILSQNEMGIEDYLKLNVMHAGMQGSASNVDFKILEANHDPDQECFLYLIKQNHRTLLYAHDTGYFKENTWNELLNEKLDCVVLDCTCCIGKSHFNGHMGFEENLQIKKRMLSLKIADQDTIFISTHFVHSDNPIQSELMKALKPNGFLAAYDGMEIEF